jgi:hypothetical protein
MNDYMFATFVLMGIAIWGILHRLTHAVERIAEGIDKYNRPIK